MPLEFAATRPPIPPADLIRRVVQPFAADAAEEARRAFDEYAVAQLEGLERALALVGHEFSDFERLLDFGCGPGRYVRHFGPLAESTEIYGADIDGDVISWLQENVPYGQFAQIDPNPQTPYPDGHFDLVINHSVFTHLPETMQDEWLTELQRITRPGATLLLSLHSTQQFNFTISAMEAGGEETAHLRETLESDGFLFIADDHFIGSTHPDFYHSTFHAPWYVFERWTAWFDVVAFVPLGSDSQDLVVLRRRDDGVAPERPIGHARSTPPAAPTPAADSPERRPVSLAAAAEKLATRPSPQTVLGRLKRRAMLRDLDRQEELNRLLLQGLEDLNGGLGGLNDRLEALSDAKHDGERQRDRETRMLRVGLYELGERLSLLSNEIRESGRP